MGDIEVLAKDVEWSVMLYTTDYGDQVARIKLTYLPTGKEYEDEAMGYQDNVHYAKRLCLNALRYDISRDLLQETLKKGIIDEMNKMTPEQLKDVDEGLREWEIELMEQGNG